MLRPIAAVAAALALLVSCSDPSSGGEGPAGGQDSGADAGDTGPPTLEARQAQGRWLAGDFHVHATGASNDAADESTPARIKEVAMARGLDFVVLTDHSNSTGSDTTTTEEDPALFNQGPEFPYWERAAELSDEAFLMVDGNEISPVDPEGVAPTGHVGCYPRDLATFDPTVAFVDRPRGTVTGGQVLTQAVDAGCFTTINHPHGVAVWIAYDWTNRTDYDALEVWNGGAGFDEADRKAVDSWACDLSQGKATLAIAGSDNHKTNVEPPGHILDPPLAQPVTYVWAPALDWAAIVEGLDARRVSLSDTSRPLELDAHDASGAWLGMTGDAVAAGAVRWLRVRGSGGWSDDESRRLRVYRVASGGCDDRRRQGSVSAPVPDVTVVHDQPIAPAEAVDLTVEVALEPGDAVFAIIEPETTRIPHYGVALSNAIRAQ